MSHLGDREKTFPASPDAGRTMTARRDTTAPGPRPAYQRPRLAKKRSVSQATLFTGSGPSSGGVVGAAG